MSHHLYKLIPPRPSFGPGDMSDEEAALMGEHAAYWTGLMADGHVLAFGPVLDPGGTWGLALVATGDEATARGFGEGDPAVRSGRFTFDVHAMPMTATPG
jgi:uncharacterized protein YciI